MIITLISKNNEKTFTDKEIINIGSNPDCDFVVDIGSKLVLTLQCDNQNNKCSLFDNATTFIFLLANSSIINTILFSTPIYIGSVIKIVSSLFNLI